jgi:hypothetical protein
MPLPVVSVMVLHVECPLAIRMYHAGIWGSGEESTGRLYAMPALMAPFVMVLRVNGIAGRMGEMLRGIERR